MANKWNIKIDETDKPFKGFFVSVENNGEYVGAIKGAIQGFDRAIQEGKMIIMNHIKQMENKLHHARIAQSIFSKEFLMNPMYKGIYGIGIMADEKNEPYLEVMMDTTNEYLSKLVPNKISVPNTPFEFSVKKVYGEQSVAQNNPNLKK